MDQKLLFFINREWTHPALDWVMVVFSSFGLWFWPMLISAALIVLLGGFRGRAFLVTALLVVGFNDGLLSGTLKKVVGRPRPFQSHNDVRKLELGRGKSPLQALAAPLKVTMSRPDFEASSKGFKGRSFPSSHTINTISLATVCLAFYGSRGLLAFLPALVVGYSRIYTGSHWPSDVFISLFIGFGASLVLLLAVDWAWSRFGGKLMPRIHSVHPRLLAS